jgi:hypothetical protein
MACHIGEANLCLFAVTCDQRSDEINLARKVLVDAGLSNAVHIGNVSIAEAIVATGCYDQPGTAEDIVGGVRDVAHAPSTTV